MSVARQLGRRAFLRGAGGAMIGLPFLHALSGRGHAQATRPMRVVVFFHPQGMLQDRWQPAIGTLTSALPPLLAPLESYKSQLLVLSGIDNVVAGMNTASNGHNGAARSLLTCQPFQSVRQGQNPANAPADGPSIDAVLGARLRGGAARLVINLGVSDEGLGENAVFWSGAGQSATINCDPRAATSALFANVVPKTEPAPARTPAQLLRSRRASVLDAVGAGVARLAQRVPGEDRARLDAHLAQVRALELSSNGAGELAQASCGMPTNTFPGGYSAGSPSYDDVSANAQIENLVMGLACDLTRVTTLQFTQYHSPNFAYLFGGDPQAVLRGSRTYSDWHAMVHEAAASGDAQGVENLARGYTWYMQKLALLVKRLGEIEDGPEGTLLDSTLVLSITEFGNASQHATSRLPVLLIGGLGGRLRTGRHLDMTGYTTGDLFTTVQAITTGVADPFGITGAWQGRAFHRGLLPDLG
jgi:hypothetical protein